MSKLDSGNENGPVPTRPKQRNADSWGSKWLKMLDSSKAISNEALERGRAYALHDWQLEVDLEPGKAEALARSGPRIRNRASIQAPGLSKEQWDVVVGLIAKSSARTAALLDHELDLRLLDEAKENGVRLLPTARSLKPNCTCRNWGELCKHASAVAYLLGDVFDEAPFDLLLWRGLPYDDLVERVREARRSELTPESESEAGDDSSAASDDAGEHQEAQSAPAPLPQSRATINALDAWNRDPAPIPEPLAVPQTAATIPPYPSDAPPNAPFTGAGLHSLVDDAVGRAHRQRLSGESPMLDLGIEADLGRRSALAEGTANWNRLVLHSGRPSRELSTRAHAWHTAGSVGVEITVSSRQVLEINKFVQFRKSDTGSWFRFEKVSGRWKLISGPAEDPSDLEDAEDESDL